MPRKKQQTEELATQKNKPEFSPAQDVFDLVITRSYSRKLNLSAHGGTQFETLDISAARTARALDPKKEADISNYLYTECVNDVEEAIKQFDALQIEAIEENEQSPKKAKKKSVLDELEMSQEEIKQISGIINKLVAANSKEELELVGKEIAAIASELNETQLSYLRTKFNKKADVIK